MSVGFKNKFPIGTAGQPWGDAEKAEWFNTRTIQRSYKDEVLTKIEALKERFNVQQYGSLPLDRERYPLYVVTTRNWEVGKPYVLVTGGVHGYEKSGVQGALLFLTEKAEAYSKTFNIVVAPCVSPWGYETIQRWNEQAVDPNRSFNPHGEIVPGRSFNPEPATEQSKQLIAFLDTLKVDQWLMHVDCHETTDTDESEFRPAKAARDGVECKEDSIPDGFYLVSDSTNPQEAWHKAMIDSVRKVTHIAPADADGKIIGESVVQEGVIAIPSPKSLGLCSGMTNATFASTTEVYPDSPKATEDQCNEAQVACLAGALDYLIEAQSLPRL